MSRHGAILMDVVVVMAVVVVGVAVVVEIIIIHGLIPIFRTKMGTRQRINMRKLQIEIFAIYVGCLDIGPVLVVFGCAVYVPIPPPQKTKMGPQRRLGIYIGFESSSIIKYLEPMTGDQFTARLPNAFIDIKKVTKSHIPIENVPACLEVPEAAPTQPKASESQIRRKRGRPLGSKDANPRKRKEHIVSINHDANVINNNVSKDKILKWFYLKTLNRTESGFVIIAVYFDDLNIIGSPEDIRQAADYLKIRSLDVNKDPFRPPAHNDEILGPEVPYLSAIGALICGDLSDPHKAISQSGYVFMYGGTAFSWRSTKQTLVATSSTHAELIALYEAGRECVWLRSLIHYVCESCGLKPIEESPTVIYEDNAACIAQIKDGYIKGDRTKHISPKFFSTYDLQVEGKVDVKQIPSSQNLADLFTMHYQQRCSST
ncbi:hypothetical protein Sango_1578200 [Sesamum angolense]|uniref:Uncharacterized protein n=1 Tax=Sesamum angolense TaxID=2727404 RepID=A0AAE2BTQ0_9LAMI|nr:hypothetical protein Sango_1578200 [Sesamum angolense]